MQPANPSPDPAALLHAALPGDEPAAAWQPPSVSSLAPKFPELALEECIGQGGMAAVYRAVQTRLGRRVALKVMRPDLAAAPEFTERFVREARALAALSNAHVLAIHDFGERDGTCYLVTEYVDGANLRELMQLGRLSPAEVLRIVPQICAGLAFAHQHGIVHRDIKPENVLVDRDGQVKLADFGLAKLADQRGATSFTRSGQVFGTPHYMAPEQWQGSAGVDHRADIYSLGVVLYELLTGRLPVGTYPPASAELGVPKGIDQVVQRTLQQEPEQRYQSMREVQRDLERERAAPTPGQASAPAAVGGSGTANHRATWLLVAALVWLMLGGAALLGLFVSERQASIRMAIAQHEDARNGAIMDAMRSTIAKGEAWQNGLPEPVSPLRGARFTPDLLAGITGLGGLAVTAIVLLLAFAAFRQARHVGSSRVVQVLAGVLLALPVLGPIGGAIGWFADRVGGDDGLVRFLAMITVAGVGYAFARALWRQSATRLPGQPRPMGKAAGAAMLLAVLTVVALCILVTLSPRQPDWQPTTRLPRTARELTGLDRTQVLDRLGPPLGITASPTSMIWGYRGIDGQERSDALLFTNGVVTMSQHPTVLLVPDLAPANGVFAGQAIEELLRVLGPATDTSIGEGASSLSWADGTNATVSRDGIVLHVGK